jgi:DNA-binding IclR family transcriptional regulator
MVDALRGERRGDDAGVPSVDRRAGRARSEDEGHGMSVNGGERSTVARVFHALELLAARPRTPSELARDLGIDRSSALRLLRQLVATGYVTRDEVDQRYRCVGSRFMSFVTSAPDHADLSDLVDPVLREFRLRYGEASLLAVPARGTMVYAVFFPSKQLLGVRERLGATRPMHCSAVGKAYLSRLDDAALAEELERVTFIGGTDHAPTDRSSLYHQVIEARKAGYAVEHDETSIGVSCVAVPLSIGGSLMGALGMTGPSTRLVDQLAHEIGKELRRAALDLEHRVDRVGRAPA